MESYNHGQPLKIYFSTVVRSAPQELGGELVLLDWNSKTIQARRSIYPVNPEIHDPNPRGNSRGGRGVEFMDGSVVVANYHTLEIFDRNLQPQRSISNTLMVGLHEICKNTEGQIVASSTAIDAAISIDFRSGNIVRQYWPREMSVFQKDLDVTPLEIDKTVDNRALFLDEKNSSRKGHLHLNAVACWRGETYALLNKYATIVNLDRCQIVIQDRSLLQPHNLLIEENGIAIVNNTFKRATHIYDLNTRRLERVIKLTDFGLVRGLIARHDPKYFLQTALRQFVSRKVSAPRPIFVRGLDKFGDLLFVGISPATILCIDWKSGKLVNSYHYSDDVAICIHGLRILAE